MTSVKCYVTNDFFQPQTTQTPTLSLKPSLFPAIPTNPSRLEVPMNSKFSFLSLLLLVLFSTQISFANKSAEALARKAVSENAAEASPAIEELRALGPAGLQALMAQYRRRDQPPRRASVSSPQTSNGNASQRHSTRSLNKRTATSPVFTGTRISRVRRKLPPRAESRFSRCGC